MAWWDRFLEKRQQSSYTDTLVQYLISQVSGQAVSQPTATAAVESSAGAVARAFESAEAKGPMQLNFDSLMASDISGRARAFQSMVGGGLDVAKAAALSGLMTAEA